MKLDAKKFPALAVILASGETDAAGNIFRDMKETLVYDAMLSGAKQAYEQKSGKLVSPEQYEKAMKEFSKRSDEWLKSPDAKKLWKTDPNKVRDRLLMFANHDFAHLAGLS
jgi:hypothetical protein